MIKTYRWKRVVNSTSDSMDLEEGQGCIQTKVWIVKSKRGISKRWKKIFTKKRIKDSSWRVTFTDDKNQEGIKVNRKIFVVGTAFVLLFGVLIMAKGFAFADSFAVKNDLTAKGVEISEAAVKLKGMNRAEKRPVSRSVSAESFVDPFAKQFIIPFHLHAEIERPFRYYS